MIKFIIGLPYLRHGDEFDSNLLPSFNPSGILLGFPLLLLSMISGQCWGEFRHYLYPEFHSGLSASGGVIHEFKPFRLLVYGSKRSKMNIEPWTFELINPSIISKSFGLGLLNYSITPFLAEGVFLFISIVFLGHLAGIEIWFPNVDLGPALGWFSLSFIPRVPLGAIINFDPFRV